MDYEGREISASDLLDYVREIVTDYAVKQILHNGISAELSPLTRFYILWRWTYGEAKVHFDDARLLAQSTGLNLEREWNKGIVIKEGEFIRVLGPQDRKLEEIDSKEMIDVLHKAVLLWRASKRSEMIQLLTKTGYGLNDTFYKVAQAIVETLRRQSKNSESKEMKLLDGFLSERKEIKKKISEKVRGEKENENKEKRREQRLF